LAAWETAAALSVMTLGTITRRPDRRQPQLIAMNILWGGLVGRPARGHFDANASRATGAVHMVAESIQFGGIRRDARQIREENGEVYSGPLPIIISPLMK
jgi:hypothetical protein